MKQKKLTRKERKQQRDAELAKRGIDPEARRKRASAGAERGFIDMEEASEMFLAALLGSAALADEPELAEIIVNPSTALRTADEVDEWLNLSPEEEANLDEDQREAVQEKFQNEFITRLLTKDLKKNIKLGVDKLVARVKDTDDALYMTASAVQTFMEDNHDSHAWANLGVVAQIVFRSGQAGLAMSELAADPILDRKNPGETIRRLSKPGISHPFIDALKKIPGLRTLLEKQVDRAWEAGIEAVWSGELRLGIFSPDELDATAQIMRTVLPEGDKEADIDRAQAAELFSRISEYLTALFTAQRIEQLRDSLAAHLEDEPLSRTELEFIGLVLTRSHEDEFVEYEMSFLTKLLFSELRYFEGEDEADEE